jgi:hypothetical protein
LIHSLLTSYISTTENDNNMMKVFVHSAICCHPLASFFFFLSLLMCVIYLASFLTHTLSSEWVCMQCSLTWQMLGHLGVFTIERERTWAYSRINHRDNLLTRTDHLLGDSYRRNRSIIMSDAPTSNTAQYHCGIIWAIELWQMYCMLM